MKTKGNKKHSSGISLIVLVITIIVIIILAVAVILTLNKNNPIEEANKARYESDVANMQAIFTNTVAKVMAQNQGTIKVNAGSLNSVKSGGNSTEGRVNYNVNNPLDSSNENGVIIFNTGTNNITTYYTGKKLPLYSSGETTWYVDNEGVISLKVGEMEYGNGSKNNELAGDIEGEEIVASENPMLQSWWNDKTTDFHAEEYRTKITKVKFAVNVKVPNSKIASWDVSDIKDKSVMAWLEDDGNNGYILTIAGRNKIIANSNSGNLFDSFSKVTEIENLDLLETSNVENMYAMFIRCYKLEKLDLSGFNTNNVTNMGLMFCYCYMLENIEFGNNFNTDKVTNMNSMFESCYNLTNLDLSNFVTSRVTDMGGMFMGCKKIKSLDLSNFDTSNVTVNMAFLFRDCNNLVATINMSMIKNNYYNDAFLNAATIPPAKIIVNYTSENSDLVDRIIATKSSNSNVVKGTQIN